MAAKSVSIRLTDSEIELFARLAEERGIDRTKLVRQAVKHYAYCDKNTTAVAKEIVEKTIINNSAGVSHPLLTKIEQKGIVIHRPDGTVLTKISTIEQLLDFVNTKVLIDEV